MWKGEHCARRLAERGAAVVLTGPRIELWNVTAETGHSTGASGIAIALLHMHLADQDKYQAILLPDNPFPASRRA